VCALVRSQPPLPRRRLPIPKCTLVPRSMRAPLSSKLELLSLRMQGMTRPGTKRRMEGERDARRAGTRGEAERAKGRRRKSERGILREGAKAREGANHRQLGQGKEKNAREGIYGARAPLPATRCEHCSPHISQRRPQQSCKNVAAASSNVRVPARPRCQSAAGAPAHSPRGR